MTLNKLYDKIVSQSPYLELLVRNLYWHNANLLQRLGKKNSLPVVGSSKIDFNEVLHFLSNEGVCKGCLVVCHSAMEPLRSTGMTSNQVLDRLISLVGPNGTIAMPVIRHFKGEPKYDKILSTSTDGLVCTYDVQKSPIVSGFLPYTLMSRKESVTSRFPLNPLCAIGPLANDMVKNNIDGECPSPHGPNSCWNFCYNHDAVIIGLGVDFPHRLTMLHVFEESFAWPIKHDDWYRKRVFNIIDGDFIMQKIVLERKPKWGMLHSAERTFRKDLLKFGVLHEKFIGDVSFSVIHSKDLALFLKERRKVKKTYPYYLCK